MKKILLLNIVIVVFLLSSCGSGSNEKRARSYQDSIYKVDSIEKSMTVNESWDIFKLGLKNAGGLVNKYGNKRIKIKNLVLDEVMNDNKTVHCLAYSPKDSMLSSTSQKGDKLKKVAEWIDIVNDVQCKNNPDFTYFFELQFSEPVDTSALKQKIITEEYMSKKTFYRTILTVEGDSLAFNSNTFYLRNCVIKENIMK